jgi:hypothetical protein
MKGGNGSMAQVPIDARYAVYLLIAVTWTTLFSLTIRDPIRGFRNFGILACYVLLIVMLFRLHFVTVLVTWCAFGVAGGILYSSYELVSRARVSETDKDSKTFIPRLFVDALLMWPIMTPEAIECLFAELRVLGTPKQAQATSEPGPPGPDLKNAGQ